MTNKNGRILWGGPSTLTGEPIVAIATGLSRSSLNPKTGSVVQTWILPTEGKAEPAESVCGDCKFRTGACYVNWGRAPAAILRSYRAGNYGPMGVKDWCSLRGKVVRMGAAGDPAAAPVGLWKQLSEFSKSWVGYTHQWRDPQLSGLKPILMASVDSPQEMEEAKALGWRTFRTILPWEMVRTGEILCPASKEAGELTQCQRCRLCSGASTKAKDIAIQAHGSTCRIKSYQKMRASKAPDSVPSALLQLH